VLEFLGDNLTLDLYPRNSSKLREGDGKGEGEREGGGEGEGELNSSWISDFPSLLTAAAGQMFASSPCQIRRERCRIKNQFYFELFVIQLFILV
jgi:hypothetical protein